MIRAVKPKKKIILIVIDGLGDRPVNGKTPLSEAKKPNIDWFAERSRKGMHTFGFVAPGSAIAHWLLFGYDVDEFPGRGVFEALGYNIKLKEGWTVFRANFATVDENLVVIDRRAGDDETGLDELEKEIKKIAKRYNYEFYRTKGHRGVLIIKEEIEFEDDVDPYEVGKKVNLPVDDKLREFLLEVHEALEKHPVNKRRKVKANFLLLRGYSIYRRIEKFEERYKMRALAIADYPLYKGVPKFLGFDVIDAKDEDKIKILLENFENYDFFFVHFKKADTYGERGKFEEKKRYIEFVDSLLEPLKEVDAIICITGDHSTPCCLKSHSGDPCPFLVYNPEVPGDGVEFDELNAWKGYYGIVDTSNVFFIILNEAGGLKPCKEYYQE